MQVLVFMKSGYKGFRRLWYATGNSLRGLKLAWQFESAFRQDLLLCALLIAVTCWLPVTPIEQVLLLMPLAVLLISELLNSAIETLVDRVSDEIHILSGRAKDMGSAAVLIALVLIVVVWSIVLVPKLLVD